MVHKKRKNFQLRLAAFIFFFFITAVCPAQNFTNKGKEFWVGYGHNELFAANQQNMILYLSTEQAANVTVSINGTSWVRNYAIPANSAIPTDLIPKTGADDCRITAEGLFSRGIHIVSDVPIVAYAHTYGSYSSGATMLLPVETYSYTYYSVNSEQNASNSYSWFYVVASEANTTVRITPSRPTAGGRAQGVPFTVNLNKGEIYNVMGQVNGNSSYDVSGSKIQSLPGADGICHPVGVFSGSSRTYICSGLDPLNSGSDYIMQQVFPLNAWGVKYITAPTSKSTAASALNPNKYRVYVRDANTLVRRNGVLLSGLVNNIFYDFVSSSGGDVITATKPILMAQFIPSANGCGTTGLGDPEMFIISPVEQAIKNIVFYNTDKQAIGVNYLTLVIPQNGLSSLQIDGSNSFDHTYSHPNAPGYTVVVKQLPLTPMQHRASSDSAFTSITYGLGDFESYGYNAGTNLRNLESNVQVKNLYGTGLTAYACAGTPFHPVFKTTYKPASILWKLSEVAHLSPNTDVLQTNPVPTDSVTEFQRKFYLYQLPGNYTFSTIGTDTIPVVLTDLLIENCSFSTSLKIPVTVVAGPDVDFTALATQCVNRELVFTGVSSANIFPTKWLWTFGDGSIDSVQTVPKVYTNPGTYNVNLTAVRTDGCINSRQKPVTVLPAAFTAISKIICEGQSYNGHTTTGIYQDTLPGANSCDSIISLDLLVKPKSFSTIAQSICAGQSYEGYTLAGVYTDIFVAANGCDSVRTLNLSVRPTSSSTVTQSICEGQSYLGYNSTGVYVDIFTGSNGCDSVRTLNLTVNPVITTSITHSICQGQSYLGYHTTGTYTDTFTGSNGCDSTRTLNLTVHPLASSTLVQNICEGQSFEGYTSTGVYTDTFTGSNGCDSTRTLQLTVVPKIYTTVSHAICEGQSYMGYNTTGTYTDTYTSAAGCDSIRTLNLTVKLKVYTTVTHAICEGQSYLGYNQAGTYTDTFTGANGCDSIRTLHLAVIPAITTSMEHTICEGETYMGYTTAGVYNDVFISAAGCDSTRRLVLKVLAKPAPELGPDQELCSGQQLVITPGVFSSYSWQDLSVQDHFVVTQAGLYTVTVANSCGTATDRVRIDYKTCEPYFPNAFTPNRDGKNDVFRILYDGVLDNYDLKIFNRYGSLIFHSRQAPKGWDGTWKGQPADPGNYVWIASFLQNNIPVNLKGSVILIR